METVIIILSVINVIAICLVIKYLVERKKDKETLLFYKLLYEASKPTYFIYDIEHKLVRSSPALVDLFGGGGGQATPSGLVIEDFPESAVRDGRVYEHDILRFMRFYDDIRAGRKTQGEIHLRVRDDGTGKYLWASAVVATLPFKAGTPKMAIGLMRDLNLTHKLTGVDNKDKFFQDAVRLLSQKSYTYAFVLLDLKDFSLFNDINGFDEGDDLICHMADVIRIEADTGELCAHSYSDRFFLLLRFTDTASFKSRMQKILDDIKDFPLKSGLSYTIRPYAGIHVVRDTNVPMDSIIDWAGIAQESVKRHSKHEIAFFEASNRSGLLRLENLKQDIDLDLEQGRFLLHVQPIYSTKDERILGGEVLTRWDSRSGYLMPEEYVSVFERNGYIFNLDMYVLKNTCVLLQELCDEQLTATPLYINMSGLHLYDPDFADKVNDVVTNYSFDRTLLRIEFDETVAYDNEPLLKYLLDRLHKYGFSISLDKFGRDYASMDILRRFRLDTVKFESDFHSNPQEAANDECVIIGTVEMAHKLGITAVAKCIETQASLERVKRLGFDAVQGFCHGEPLLMQEFTGLLQASK